MATPTKEAIPKPPRRFARLPHDSQTERIAAEWAEEVTPFKAFEQLVPELERHSYLSTTEFQERFCCTLTRSGDDCTQMCNAVSGWAGSPMAALVDLAFRWTVLCRESWVLAHHVKLVSEVS